MLKLSNTAYKEIPGFHNYMISENGVVYSLPRKQIIAQASNWAGYQTVTITDDTGYRAPRKVHRLVYLTYVGPLEDGKVIDHIDNNKLNNHYTNLQQITPSENSTKSFISGKNKEKVVWEKSTIEDICKMIEKNFSEEEIFESLNVDYKKNKKQCDRLVDDLIRGTIHTDITSKYDLSKYIPCINKKDAKLIMGDVTDIYTRLMFGNTYPAYLARMYKVTFSTICKIRDKKTWRKLTDALDEKFKINQEVKSSTTIPSGSTSQANGDGNGSSEKSDIVSSASKDVAWSDATGTDVANQYEDK